MNHNNSVTATRRHTGPDPTGSGTAVSTTATVWDGVRCTLVPLRAAEAVESWGDATPTRTNTVTASLWLDTWQQLLPETTYTLDAYTLTVEGSPYAWAIQAVNAWSNVTHYLLIATT